MKKGTALEKETRIFNHYKSILMKSGKEHGQIRMNLIEYVCSFPKIDPFKMAKSLVSESFHIVFDDSSISQKENEQKRKAVEKLIK